jgi:predicted metalloprotease with PDZ domain
MPDDIGPESLRNDWIAIHEFSHLLHPFVQREDAWLSEGLATYLQEVLRVRAGMMSADEAWRRLYEGAALGRDADGSLSSETQRMPYAGNYRTVYWAGAAIALMVDVELRRRSEGRESLDSALASISRRTDLMSKPATAESLLAGLDASLGGRTCSDVAQPYIAGRGLPDLTDMYRQLGLLDATAPMPTSWPVQLKQSANAPLAWIRDAIMAVQKSPVSGG